MIDPTCQREFARISAALRVRITADGRLIETRETRDISFKGIYVHSDRSLPVDRHCHVEIWVDPSARRPEIEIEGRIARTDHEGLGIRFTEITMASYIRLSDLLRGLAPEPAPIGRGQPQRSIGGGL